MATSAACVLPGWLSSDRCAPVPRLPNLSYPSAFLEKRSMGKQLGIVRSCPELPAADVPASSDPNRGVGHHGIGRANRALQSAQLTTAI
ncbi:hypothetical protein VTJ04DRAFT_7734 [Mycothermus thermophilus]|uniref:uncharacterized protein n=1 Tax=Humicola insolens TaxID=85995 RepID=UPI003742E9AD